MTLLSQYVIQILLHSVLLFFSNEGVCWSLKKSDCPLVAPRVIVYFVTSMAGIVFKLASLDHAIEYTE